ncbi:hypothetical protein BV898_11500 [Hypsibius exemplaris]|uniref:Uncharacterized protein n=1 Tax=Hypsibius exemplaris TaxID=2072580 RepID=A0A1W0WGL1_HYPEX|nr:hypothetical protein BV898_11500 [Hypsibius exemplaris]
MSDSSSADDEPDDMEIPAAAATPISKPRRGRPPGSKNVKSLKIFVNSMRASSSGNVAAKGKKILRAQTSAVKTSNKVPTPSSETPKKRGRPPGSKNKVSKARNKSTPRKRSLFPGVAAEAATELDFIPALNAVTHREQRNITRREARLQAHSQSRKSIASASESDSSDDGDTSNYATSTASETIFVVADKILRNQVDFLVEKAGASRRFRKTVMELWFSYLTIAVPDVSRSIQDAIMNDKAWLNSLRPQDFSCLMNCKETDLNAILNVWREQDLLMKETRVDNSQNRNDNSRSQSGRKRKTDFNGPLRKHGSLVRADHIFRVPERLTISRILSIVMLGLLYCDERILISDVLRWTRAMHFPFLDLNHDVSQDLTASELQTAKVLFSQERMTSYGEIEFHMTTVAKLFQLGPTALPRQNVVPLVVRFVEELNLPRDLIPFVTEFLEGVNCLEHRMDVKGGSATYAKRRACGVEALAMAAIVYSLRLLFGLDGVAERKLAEETATLNDLLDGTTLFNFQEWCKHIQYRRHVFFRHCPTFRFCSVPASLSLVAQRLKRNRPDHAGATVKEVIVSDAYTNLQCALQKLELPDTCDDYDTVLPPTLRPYRAHAVALSDKYRALNREFDDESLFHVMSSRKVTFPKQWTLKDEATRSDALRHLGCIRSAQAAARHDFYPLRSYNIRGTTVEPNMDFVPAESLRFVIDVAAEMIEQPPGALLGQLLYLEIGMFPRNVDCVAVGKGFHAIERIRQGE